MDVPYVRGKVALQAHVGLPEGSVEEEYARNGFFGRYAHLYRKHAPVGWTRIEGPLKPRLYDLSEGPNRGEPAAVAASQSGDLVGARVTILENADVRVQLATLEAPTPYFFRNADADDLFFVHAGAGRLETDFGPLTYQKGDYLLVPRGTAYRFAPTSKTALLAVESMGELAVPDRGMLGQHALFDPAVLVVPTPGEGTALAAVNGEYELRIQRCGELTRVFYPFSPIETVGWKGTLAPMKLAVNDIRPVSSDRYHLPPSAHTTFLAPAVVVCTFAPRPLENGDPTALKVPFFHSNIDFDEVLFYHAGEFFSRAGVGAGMMTFHPQGIHHGPQAKAEARSKTATATSEIAIMIDTKRPLFPSKTAGAFEVENYWKSWQESK
ncbi:MAG: homogentisate 1,2-dioxygenase [Myxococcales bacterium]|nr:homogentisate 1,2-dioxygenase [Myxococcales bacterium]